METFGNIKVKPKQPKGVCVPKLTYCTIKDISSLKCVKREAAFVEGNQVSSVEGYKKCRGDSGMQLLWLGLETIETSLTCVG